MTVKLDFNTDFTYLLENNEFHDYTVKVVTESEIIKCSAVLLAQHSTDLRESIKEDTELFLTDNKHVRECLSVLYGGSVKLTDENFQDILKFMVAFGIPVARKQVLDWMSQNIWNLDNASLLINGSMAAAKAFGTKPQELTSSKESLQEEVYKPCRLFFGEHLVKMIRSDSTDVRYQNLDSAMECVISGVVDKKELVSLLLHQDLIPDYVPWVKMLINQTSYNLFLNSLDRPDISNAMSLCPRTQFEELFDKIEDFENMTLKEYKQLNRYKMKINEKITVVQSLKFMKECGSFYSCWKVLDADGMTVLSTAFTDKSDQFCIIECLLSWISANKSSCDMDIVGIILSKAIRHLSGGPDNNISFQTYCVSYVRNTLATLQTPPCQYPSISGIPLDRYTFNGISSGVTFGDEILLTFVLYGAIYRHSEPTYATHVTSSGSPIANSIVTFSEATIEQYRSNVKFTVRLSQDRIPAVSCDDPTIGNYRHYVYAWKVGQVNQGAGHVNTATRVPLYCEPEEAYKTINQAKAYHQNNRSYNHNEEAKPYIKDIHFAILCVGVHQKVQ